MGKIMPGHAHIIEAADFRQEMIETLDDIITMQKVKNLQVQSKIDSAFNRITQFQKDNKYFLVDSDL